MGSIAFPPSFHILFSLILFYCPLTEGDAGATPTIFSNIGQLAVVLADSPAAPPLPASAGQVAGVLADSPAAPPLPASARQVAGVLANSPAAPPLPASAATPEGRNIADMGNRPVFSEHVNDHRNTYIRI